MASTPVSLPVATTLWTSFRAFCYATLGSVASASVIASLLYWALVGRCTGTDWCELDALIVSCGIGLCVGLPVGLYIAFRIVAAEYPKGNRWWPLIIALVVHPVLVFGPLVLASQV